MNKKLYIAVIGLASILIAAFTAYAAVTTNVKEPFSQDVFVPCAAGGVGELLTISGTLHVLTTLTLDEAGGVHGTSHFQPQGVSGVGSVTGDTYRGVGITRESFNINSSELPYVYTYVNNFYMIGTAGAVKYKVHETIHVTINENGNLTADVDNISATCS